MLIADIIKLAESDFSECLETLRKKGNDYAAEIDGLSNFKYSGDFAGVTQEQSCKVLIGTKLARLRELTNNPNKVVANESVNDTIKDLINYLILWKSIRNE
ncbi:MAG TPA: hypothetical protein VI815_02785 [Candidatus Nanoarchaeia archaeon]|nr:hypothetical protein [Candidatus Nanoarchaeia archaeon]